MALMDKRSRPRFKTLHGGDTLVTEGEEGSDVFLVLDGVMRVEKGGERLAEYGPGAILGERAGLEGGRRMSSLIAVTPCRVAVVAWVRAVRTGARSPAPSGRRGAIWLPWPHSSGRFRRRSATPLAGRCRKGGTG